MIGKVLPMENLLKIGRIKKTTPMRMNRYKSNKLKNTLLLFFALTMISCEKKVLAQEEEEVKVPEYDGSLVIGEPTGETISSLLTGVNAVYAHEDMNTWLDGKKLNNLKETGISAMRYPGGHVVSYWDWEFPYHETYQEFWNPSYEASFDDAKRNELMTKHQDRMLLDDYFNICQNGNIEPVIGINMFQGWKYDRTEEAIQKAVTLVEHALEQDPTVKYFFLDNEAGHQPTKNNHIPIDDYIELIPAYSQAIKAVHPGAKLIPNIMNWNTVKRMIQETGQHWDVYDQHWYYSSGKWSYFNLNHWRDEVENKQQADRVKQFNSWKNQFGMHHLEMSYLEWNGPPPDLTEDSFPKSLSNTMLGLIQADQLMFFAKNGIHMAIAWPMTWQTSSQDVDVNAYNRNLLDRDDSNWLSPSATIFKAFSYVQNGKILNNNNDAAKGLRVLTVERDQGKGYAVLVINKSNAPQTLEITVPGGIKTFIVGKHFTEGTAPKDVNIETITPELIEGKLYQKIQGTSFMYVLVE